MSYANSPEDLAFYEALGPEHKVNLTRPEVEDDAMAWYAAFQELSLSRPPGMAGAVPIPISEIEAYCRFTGVAEPERQAFLRVMRQLDLGFLGLLHDMQKKKKSTTSMKAE